MVCVKNSLKCNKNGEANDDDEGDQQRQHQFTEALH